MLDIFGSGYAVSCDGLSLGCGRSHLLSTEMVFDAWASFDVCASCMEPGAPWVTEASSFAVFFFFSFFQSLDLSCYSSLYIWISLAFIFFSHTMDDGCRGCMDSVLIP